MPVPLTEQLMARGQQRYAINCAPCHGAQGDGNGITKSFGMTVIGNLHDPRMVSMSDGELFWVVTHGRNLMGAYGAQVDIADRWAIIAYVRALQRTRLGASEDVVETQRARFTQ
jgi:mono/diheme cytochrome c family protein